MATINASFFTGPLLPPVLPQSNHAVEDGAPGLPCGTLCGSPGVFMPHRFVLLVVLPMLPLFWGCQSSAQPAPRTAENGPIIDFVAPDQGARWTVRAADGSELCSLPCKGRIGDDSGYFLQREPGEKHGKLRIDLPAKLGPAAAGVRVVPHAGRGSPVAAVATGVASLAVAAVGVAFLDAGDTRQCQYEAGSDFNVSNVATHSYTPRRPATLHGPCSATTAPEGFQPKDGENIGRSAEANRNLGLVIAGVGLLGAGLSVAWWSWSESPRIDILAPGQGGAPVLRLGPGFAQGTF